MNPSKPPCFPGRATLSRRFLPASIFVLASSLALGADVNLNLREAIASGDLDYTSPATRSEEGMPVGNGRMGSLVWTTPGALKI